MARLLIFLIFLLLIISSFLAENLLTTGLPFLFSSMLLALIILVFYSEKNNGKVDLFQPILCMGLFFFLPNFVIKAWYVIFIESENPMLRKLINRDYYFTYCLFTAFLAYLCMIIGYYTFPFKNQFGSIWLRYKIIKNNYSNLKWPCFILFCIGMLVTLYLLTKGRAGYVEIYGSGPFEQILLLISKYNYYAIFIFIFCYIMVRTNSDFSWKMLLAIILLCQLMLGFIAGSRSSLFLIGIIILAAMQYTNYDRLYSKKIILPALFIGILLFSGIFFVTQYREIKSEKMHISSPVTIINSIDLYKAVLSKEGEGYSSIGQYVFEILAGRMNNMESLALVLERAPNVKHLERAYGIEDNITNEFLWGLVPRFIYPEKPILTEFAIKFGIIYHDNPKSSRGMSNPTIIGDLYRNFGYLGIIIGMLVFGIFLRGMHLVLMEHNQNLLFYMSYLFSVIQINFESTFMGFFHSMIRLWIMFALFSLTLNFFEKLLNPPLAQLNSKRV